jgi:hypothetical protein
LDQPLVVPLILPLLLLHVSCVSASGPPVLPDNSQPGSWLICGPICSKLPAARMLSYAKRALPHDAHRACRAQGPRRDVSLANWPATRNRGAAASVGTLSPIDPATANPARRSGTLGMAGKRLGAAAGGRGVRATPWSTGLEGRWQVEIRGILRVIQSPPGGRRVQDGEGPRIFRLNCLMRVRSGGTHP